MAWYNWVGPELLREANFWDPAPDPQYGFKGSSVYTSKMPRSGINIIVIEKSKFGPDERLRNEFYISFFRGKHPGECKTMVEAEPFFRKIEETLTNSHRIRCYDLQRVFCRVTGIERKLEYRQRA